MKTYKDQKEFSWDNPKAYAALPEPYRNDSCLQFYKTMGGKVLMCEPKPDQVEVLGRWTCVYLSQKDGWVMLSTILSMGLLPIPSFNG